jgi:hypothetical protein
MESVWVESSTVFVTKNESVATCNLYRVAPCALFQTNVAVVGWLGASAAGETNDGAVGGDVGPVDVVNDVVAE